MGNTVNTLQSVTPLTTARHAKQKPTKPKSKATKSTPRILFHFVQRHPIILLFAVWGVVIYFGWLAIAGLTYINPAPVEAPKPEAITEAPKPFRIDRPASSFGLLAVVAGSCAVTSVLLARQLRPVKPAPRTSAKRVVIDPKPKRELRSRQERSRSSANSRKSTPPIKPVTMSPAQAIAKPAPKPPVRPPVVTVLPPEDSPFEMSDPSLAEMMDIRRQA